MSSLESLIGEYKDWVINDPPLIDDISQLVFENGGEEYGMDKIKETLTFIAENSVIAPAHASVCEKEDIIHERTKTNKPKMDLSRFIMLNRADRERTMNLLKHIESSIQNSHNGLTKTQLLKEMRKDNSH